MRHNRYTTPLLGLLTLGVVVAGCGTQIAPAPASNPPNPELLNGIWKLQIGANRLNSDSNYVMYDLRYIEMSEGKFVKVVCKNTGTEINYCIDGDYTTDDESMIRFTVDVNAVDGNPFAFEFDGDDKLLLIDEFGNALEFSRETEIPADHRCGEMAVKNAFEFNVRPHALTDMAFDGTHLYFTKAVEKRIYGVNPATGEIIPPLPAMGENYLMMTAEADSFWTYCHCYQYAALNQRTADTDDLKHFDLTTNFAVDPVEITSAAFDPVAKIMWVSSLWGEMYGVDTQGAEPALVGGFEFPGLDALASDGTSLFGIINAYELIVEIDPTSGRALKTWKLPSDDVEWRGIDFAGDRLMVLADDEVNNVGVLYELSRSTEPTDASSPLPFGP